MIKSVFKLKIVVLLCLLVIAPAYADLRVNQLNGFWSRLDCATTGGGGTITFLGSASDNTINGADVTVDVSGLSLAAGDVLFACGVQSDDAYNTNSMSISGDQTGAYTAAFTEVDQAGGSANEGIHFHVDYAVMGSTPDSTVTMTGSGDTSDGAAGVVFAFRGVDTSTPLDQTPTTTSGEANSSPDPSSIVTQTANAIVFACAGTGSASEMNTTPSCPTNYTTDCDSDGANDSNDAVIAAGFDEIASPTTEDPGTFSNMASTTLNSAYATATVAIKPGGGGGGTFSCSIATGSLDPAAPPFEFAYVTDTFSSSNATTYDFTSTSMGTEDANRIIVVVGETGRASASVSISSIVVDGDTGTEQVETTDLSTDGNAVAVWTEADSTGTSATISLTASAATNHAGISVNRMIGTEAASDTCGDNTDSGNALSCAADIPTDGAAVCGIHFIGSTAPRTTTWTNITERYDDTIEGNATRTGGENTTSEGTTTFTGTANGTVGAASLACATFGGL